MADTASTPKENAKSVKKGNVPLADVTFGKVTQTVAQKWVTSSWLTLLWQTATQFAENANKYEIALQSRMQTGSKRPQTTQAIKSLDKTIDNSLSYVKGYITDKYKKESAKSYYAAFGFEHKKDKYIFPIDQNNRLSALELMIEAIAANDFTDKEYGTAFWTPIHKEYKKLVSTATTTDGDISIKVGDKNALKKELKKGLNAIVNALKANYPDTYKTELRNWGFQKEKY
jgi:hypothetical protein